MYCLKDYWTKFLDGTNDREIFRWRLSWSTYNTVHNTNNIVKMRLISPTKTAVKYYGISSPIQVYAFILILIKTGHLIKSAGLYVSIQSIIVFIRIYLCLALFSFSFPLSLFIPLYLEIKEFALIFHIHTWNKWITRVI